MRHRRGSVVVRAGPEALKGLSQDGELPRNDPLEFHRVPREIGGRIELPARKQALFGRVSGLMSSGFPANAENDWYGESP